MGLPENIDALLVKYDITPSTLAKIAGVSTATVSRWRNGTTTIRTENLAKICRHFNLSDDDIISTVAGIAAKEHGGYVPPSGTRTPNPDPLPAYAPLLGRVHAGDAQEPGVLDEQVPVPYEVHRNHPRGYFLQVEGNCMSRVYPEGCYILIDPDRAPQNGSVAVVSIDGSDYVMRRMYRGATTLVLSPESWDEGYEDIVITSADERTVEFHGTVVWFQPSTEME